MTPDNPDLPADAAFNGEVENDAPGFNFPRATLLDAIDAADLLCISLKTLRELVGRGREDLLELRNFGETTLEEIEGKLREHGLHLGMQVPAGAEA